jgi:predicted MFS family arabinose efflux permease
LAGLSAGTVVGLPAGQFFGNILGWRLTFAGAAGLALVIVFAQLALLPSIPPIGRMRFAHLGDVFRIPLARSGLIAAGVITVGQFAASTFVTPFLLTNVHMGSALVTALFLGYGAGGIVGTLLGSALVARSQVGTFVVAAAGVGVILAILPVLSKAPIFVSILFVGWGLIWGLVPLALQTWLLKAVPLAPEASSAVLITVMQLSIAIGSAVGGLLVDSADLAVVFIVSGSIVLVAAVFAAIANASPDRSVGRRTA